MRIWFNGRLAKTTIIKAASNERHPKVSKDRPNYLNHPVNNGMIMIFRFSVPFSGRCFGVLTIPRGLMFTSVNNLLQVAWFPTALRMGMQNWKMGFKKNKSRNIEENDHSNSNWVCNLRFFFLKWPFQTKITGSTDVTFFKTISPSFYKLWEITTNSSIHNNPWCCLASRLTSIASIWSLQKWKNVPWIKKTHSKTTSLERTN